MSDALNIKIRHADKTITNHTVEVSVAPPWRFTICSVAGGAREYEGIDLFEAMIAFRRELDGSGSQLLCAGARVDVFPSGMSRSMSGGRRAYKNRLGIHAAKSDLVDIFEYTEPEFVSSVERQMEFHKEWTASLGSEPNAVRPLPGEIDEAKRHPGGWVYRMSGSFTANEHVPPEKIIGAWKVDSQGNIVGDFIHNRKYRRHE
jgi:hypothetical protein